MSSPAYASVSHSASPALPSGSGTAAHNATAPPKANPDRMIYLARDAAYPHQVWWLIAAFVGLVAFFQLASWALAKCSRRPPSRGQKTTADAAEKGGAPSAGTAGRGFALRNVPTAVINAYRVVAFRWTLEVGQSYTLNFAEVFVTVAYIVALFTWQFVNTTDLEGVKLDMKYWGTRAGILAVSQTPLITALGTKNNVVAYITGISYDKLNYIHRMMSRVVFVLLWVHGGAKIRFADADTWEEWNGRVALTALIAFSALILVSLRPIRAQAYEVFYFVHFFMVLIFLLGGYFHADQYRYGAYVWPSLLIWALDRFLRLARVVYYNHLYFGFSKKANRLDASVELLSPHFVRLHLQRPPHFSWTPGQTAFLTMPAVSGNPLETHPFTIASVDSHYQLAGAPPATTSATATAAATTDANTAAAEKKGAKVAVAVDAARPADDVAPYWKELTFLINVREGFTRRLAARAQRGEKVKVLVDGPYGFSPNLDNDDTVVLIAGGSGVTFTLSTFLGVLSHVQGGRSRCRRLVWVWSIREPGHIEWVSKALTTALGLAPNDLEISIRIYVTGKGRAGGGDGNALSEVRSWNEDDSIHSDEGTAVGRSRPPSLLDFDAVQVFEGRPELHALLREEVDAASGRISVTVCGSHGIARACRKALRVPLSMSLQGGPSVVLHVESFGYA